MKVHPYVQEKVSTYYLKSNLLPLFSTLSFLINDFLLLSTMEIEIVHRLSLVRISYCVGTFRVKQKRKQTKVFTNHVGGLVDSYSGSYSK